MDDDLLNRGSSVAWDTLWLYWKYKEHYYILSDKYISKLKCNMKETLLLLGWTMIEPCQGSRPE